MNSIRNHGSFEIQAGVKAGGTSFNHNESLAVQSRVTAGNDIRIANHNETLKVSSCVKAGDAHSQHNETLAIRTSLKAGKITSNHNESLRA